MSFTIIEQATPRLHRSERAVPGSNPGLFEKAAQSAADIIFLDVEDAVAPDDKEQARKNIIAALNDINWGTKTMMVRINGLDTHYMYRDVVDIVEACPRLDMILIPKAGVPADVYAVDMLVTQIEAAKKRDKRIGFEVLIETALGMANVEAIAQSSRRLEAMSFGVADYATSTRARTTVIGGVNADYGVLTNKDASGNRAYYWADQWHAAQTSHAGRLPRLWLASDRRSVRRFFRSRWFYRRREACRGAWLRGKMGDPSLANRARQSSVHTVGSRGHQGAPHRQRDGRCRQGWKRRAVARRPSHRHRQHQDGGSAFEKSSGDGRRGLRGLNSSGKITDIRNLAGLDALHPKELSLY